MKISISPSRRWLAAIVAPVLLGGLATFGVSQFPAALAQGETPTFAPLAKEAPYANEINAFLTQDRQKMPPSEGVVFVGSSTIRLWKTLAQDIPELPVINRGFGGSHLSDSVQYADRIVLPYKPKIVVLFAGTNDMAGGKSPQQVLADFQAFENKIHVALPATRIVYLSVNPTVARWKQQEQVMEANYLIEKWIFQNNTPTRKLNFIDTHSQLLSADGVPQPKLLQADGLHLNPEGYKVYTSIIKPRVLALAEIDGVKRLDAPAATAK